MKTHIQTCRICHKSNLDSNERLFPIGPRHSVHARCGLEKWGNKFLDKLQGHQLMNLPWMVLRDLGFYDEVKRRVDSHSKPVNYAP